MSDIIVKGFKFTLPEAVAQDMGLFFTAALETITNNPPKERRTEQMRLENIAGFYGLLLPTFINEQT